MRPSTNRAVLAVIPLCMLLLSLLYADKGPYSFGGNSDPEYCYLLNSLNILQGDRPYHTDHPGTPLQVLGAAIILGKGIIRHSTASVAVIRASVLRDPEAYLRAMNLALNILISAIAVWTGIRLFLRTKSIVPPLIMQFSLLCFFQVHVALGRVSPEPFLVAAILLLAPLLIAEVLAEEGGAAAPAGDVRPFVTGTVLGLALAAKVTALPLLFFLFIFDGRRKKLAAAAGCIASFVFCTLPILPAYAGMFQWFGAVVTHEGQYGTGSVGLPALGTLLSNAKELSFGEPLLPVSAVLYGIGAMLVTSGMSPRDARIDRRLKRLLWIGCLIILAQMAVTAKHPRLHYLLPSMVVASMMNAGLLSLLRRTNDRRRRTLSIVFVSVLFIGSIITGVRVLAWSQENRQYAAETAELLAKVDATDRSYKVGFYRSSLPEYALAFGNDFSGRLYGRELARLYPDTILYQIWQDFFYTFDGKMIPKPYLQGLIDRGERFVMVGTPDRLEENGRLTIEPLFRNSHEGIFRLVRTD